jgi:anti-sigma factor RsiW
MDCHISNDDLARFIDERAALEQSDRIARHLSACRVCRQRADALQAADNELVRLRNLAPSPETVAAVRETAAAELRTSQQQAIMTLPEVAAFLRLREEELEAVLPELPAFEIAGRTRVRRDCLLEWIAEREHRHRIRQGMPRKHATFHPSIQGAA